MDVQGKGSQVKRGCWPNYKGVGSLLLVGGLKL